MLHEQQDLQTPSCRARYQGGGDETKKCWHDNIKEWTDLPLAKTLRLAEDRDGWRKIIKTSVVALQPPPPPPPTAKGC